MSQSARSPGVLLSVRWGEQELAREFLPLAAPRTFTLGTDPGCDFACAGARAFPLIEIDSEGAWLRQRGGSRASLERGEPGQLILGPLCFEAQLLDGPPRVRSGPIAELATVNLCLVLMAAFGFFAVAAANRDAEGAEQDDELRGVQARVVKAMIKHHLAQASASPAPRQRKEPPAAAPPRQARQGPSVRPAPSRAPPSKLDLGALFKGPGAASVFGAGGLGAELRVASGGIRTAQAGTGLGLLGTGHGMDGNGLGGMGLEGIGALGTHGRGGGDQRYGTGVVLRSGDKLAIPKWDEPVVTGCAVDGSGCLDKELIRQVIRQNLAGFRYCYESLLNRFPSLEGKVSVHFSISQSGKVPSSRVAASTANNLQLEQCVSDRARLLQFPSRKWSGLVSVTYPFVFKQSGK